MLPSLLSAYVEKTDVGYVYESVWTEYASALFSKVFLYGALFLLVALVVIGAAIRKKKAENFPSFLKIAAGIAVTFSLVVVAAMLALGFAKIGEKGYLQDKATYLILVPPVALSLCAVIGGIVSYLCHLHSKRAGKTALYATFALLAALLIATLVCMIVYFNSRVKNDGYYDTSDGSYGNVDQLILFLASVILIAGEIVVAFLSDKKGNFSFDGKRIALAGICVSLSFALSYIKLWDLPQGGSVTLVSFLPVMLYSYLCGAKKGVFVGLVYGLLQSMQDPYIIHPAQFLLDYPIAFSAVGLAGVFKNVKRLSPQIKFALGAALGGFARFCAHTVSGIFAFGAYAIDADASNAFVYSAAYNSFIFLDILLVVVVGVILLSSKSFAMEAEKFTSTLKNPDEKKDV